MSEHDGCFASECPNRPPWVLNGRLRQVQAVACGRHLSKGLQAMMIADDERYPRTHMDNGVRVYPLGVGRTVSDGWKQG